MRTLLTLLVCGALHAQIPAAGRAQHRDSEYRHTLHRAHLQDAGGVAGAARASAQADPLRRRPPAHAAEEPPASADLRTHREQDLLHREGAAGDAARLLSRRQSLSPAETGAGRRVPRDRLAARALELRAAGAHGARVHSGALHQPGAAGLRGLLPTTWWATTTPSRRRTISAVPRNSSGTSGRSACSCGTPSARWISCNRCPASTLRASAPPEHRAAARRPFCWRRWTTAYSSPRP